MTPSLMSLALCIAIIGFVVAPLFRRSANRPIGSGAEADGSIRRWQEEKDRLIAQLRDNDLAAVEGRIDPELHASIGSKLAQDAENALARLRAARGSLLPNPARDTAPIRTGSTIVASLALIAAACGAYIVSLRADVDAPRLSNVRHPAPGVADATAGAAASNGAPDIAAMVARLEKRAAAGDYSPSDAAMLLRSYRALGRETDAATLLTKARSAFPDDVGLMLSSVEILIGDPRPERMAEAEAVIKALLAAQPDLPEARWFHSLLLVRQGRFDAAKLELDRLAPRVASNPQATEAVRSLRARIGIPKEHPPLSK